MTGRPPEPVNLLACLRRAGARLRSANDLEQSRRPFRWAIFSIVRRFRPLTYLPVKKPKTAVFFVGGIPRPSSKVAAVITELQESGLPVRAVVYGSPHDNQAAIRGLRFLLRLTWALAFALKVRRRCRRLDDVERQILLNYAFARRWLRDRPGVMPVIISDVSPGLHALWCAAAREGNRAIFWQDDFHHHEYLPYPICAAAVLNLPGLSVVKDRSTALIIARRPTSPPVRLRLIPENPTVGVATNDYFSASPEEVQRLHELADALGRPVLQLRLHPNSRLRASDLAGVRVELAAREEPMADFAARIDLAVVGNSAAQLWLLRNGVPVLHASGLDALGYDLYGYVKKKFVFGATMPLPELLTEVRCFYEDRDHHFEKLKAYTTVPAGVRVGELKHLQALLLHPSRKNADAE